MRGKALRKEELGACECLWGVNKWSLPCCSALCKEEISKVRNLKKLPREAFCCVFDQAHGVGCSLEPLGGNWEEDSDSVPSRVTSMSEHGG